MSTSPVAARLLAAIAARPALLPLLVVLAAAIAALLVPPPANAAPLGTAFTYQGELRRLGVPAEGYYDFRFSVHDAATAGTQVGTTLTHEDTVVIDGLFAVALDIGDAIIGDQQLYLAIEVREAASTGPYAALGPRQAITAAPAAAYALGAAVSESALSLATMHVLQVSREGAPYATIAAALAAIPDVDAPGEWLIEVGPGEYREDGPLVIPSFVHLRGSGPETTIVTSLNGEGNGSGVSNAYATFEMKDGAVLSDIGVVHHGSGAYGIAVYMDEEVTRATRMDNVRAAAIGGGVGSRYAVYLKGAEPVIERSVLRAGGLTQLSGRNVALWVSQASGGIPRPLVLDSRLIGAVTENLEELCIGNTGTGFGVLAHNGSAIIRRSYVCADHRSLVAEEVGFVQVEDSDVAVSSTTGSFLAESSIAAGVFISHSRLEFSAFSDNKHTGNGGFGCVLNVGPAHTPLANSNSAASACD